ncbi:MAG: GPP34 family phosphoprotein [Chloroflexi bacterium]|nr:GPP34 family phosphoprotein [Chloroflexota bacterium]
MPISTSGFSICEQLLLLGLSEHGALDRLHEARLDYAIAGASLIDLSFAGRLDSDPTRLFVIDPEPTGDELLDDVLDRIAHSEPNQSINHWVSEISGVAHNVRRERLRHLRARPVVCEHHGRQQIEFRWGQDPQVDPVVVGCIREHVMELLHGDAIPAPEDAALVSLARASGLFDVLMSKKERKRVEPRVLRLAKLDVIGERVNHALDYALAG